MAKDPTQIPVQLNVKIPWFLRELLIEEAEATKSSQSALVREAIASRLADRIIDYEREQRAQARNQTRTVS